MRRQTKRPGTTLVEASVILGVFLTLVLGMVDLAAGVFRYHVVSAAAREGARQASVHGRLASALGPWGPGAVGPVSANDSGTLAQAVRPYLTGVDPAEVTLWAEWPDGGNDRDLRVRVRVSAPYRPVLTQLLGDGFTLSATSTMPITH